MSKGSTNIKFDTTIKIPKGKLFCVNIQRGNELSCAAIEVSKTKAHRLLGRDGNEFTSTTARKLGWKLTGKKESCESCSLAKSKQKAVPKASSHVSATEPGERLFLDLSKIKNPEALKSMGKSNWLMIVDETTKSKFSSFHETKNEMINPTCTFVGKLKNKDINAKVIRCYNDGENKSLEKITNGKYWRMAIQFECTARATPQQNVAIETGFAHILNKAKAMMIDDNVPCLIRCKIMQ